MYEERRLAAQKQLDAAADARKRTLDAESKNGQEPNSEELALTTFRIMYPTCGGVGFDEICEPSTGMTLRIVAATKFKCKAITTGSDYHCAYNFKIECRGHPLICFGMQSDINSRVVKAGFRRAGNGWSLYVLSNEQRDAL